MSAQKKTVQSNEIVTQILKDETTSTSSKIRQLSAMNIERGDIVRHFKNVLNRDVRYQHVRNVLITPIKKS